MGPVLAASSRMLFGHCDVGITRRSAAAAEVTLAVDGINDGSSRLRDLGASVARDIISRGLEESIAYARAQRVGQALVIGHPRAGASEVVAMNLADGSERVLAVGEILEHPERVFRGGSHA